MGMALDEPEKNEKPMEVNGIGVLIADQIIPFADNTTIDYIAEPYREGFVIKGVGGTC